MYFTPYNRFANLGNLGSMSIVNVAICYLLCLTRYCLSMMDIAMTSASNYFHYDDLLNSEEQTLRNKVRVR